MKKISILGLMVGVFGLLGIGTNNVGAYSLNENGEYAVSFMYNNYNEDGTAVPANKILRLDVADEDVIEIGSLLTDLGFTAESPDKPKNPKSESGSYYWKIAGGENVAVETISKEAFNGFCKTEDDTIISKCARLEVVFPDAIEENQSGVSDVIDAGQSNMMDGATGAEINFQRAMPSGAVLSVKELLANDMLKGEIPPTLKKILNLAVMRENGEEVEVSGNEMIISLALPEDLAGYKYFQVVYIVDGEIKETFPAEVVDGKIIFKTTHLSAYGIQASNKPFATTENKPVMAAVDSPDTGVESFDKATSSSSKVVPLTVFGVSALIFGGAMLWRKKHSHRIKL